MKAADVEAKHGKWAALYAANARAREVDEFDGYPELLAMARPYLDRFEEAIRTAVLEGVRVGIETERGE